MRAIIILAAIALLLGLAGWITFGHNPGRTSINIETQEIKRDAKTAMENAEKMIESGVDAISDYERPGASAEGNVETAPSGEDY